MSKLTVVAFSLMSMSPNNSSENIESNTMELQTSDIKNQTSDDVYFVFAQNSNNSLDNKSTNIEKSDSSTNIAEALDSNPEIVPVNSVVNGVMKYFDKEVKNYELDEESKKKVRAQLKSYFSKHQIFKSHDGKILIQITDQDLPDFFIFCNNLIDIFADNLVWYKKLAADVFGIRKMMKKNVNNFQKELPKASKEDILDIVYDIGVALQYIEKETSNTLYLSEYYKSANRLAKNPYLKTFTDSYINSHPKATIRDLPDTSKK